MHHLVAQTLQFTLLVARFQGDKIPVQGYSRPARANVHGNVTPDIFQSRLQNLEQFLVHRRLTCPLHLRNSIGENPRVHFTESEDPFHTRPGAFICPGECIELHRKRRNQIHIMFESRPMELNAAILIHR